MVNIDYLYNPDAVKSNFDKNYFLDKKLGFQIIEHGMILPYKNTSDQSWGAGGIVDNMGNHIKDSFVHASLVSKTYTPPRINST